MFDETLHSVTTLFLVLYYLIPLVLYLPFYSSSISTEVIVAPCATGLLLCASLLWKINAHATTAHIAIANTLIFKYADNTNPNKIKYPYFFIGSCLNKIANPNAGSIPLATFNPLFNHAGIALITDCT